MCISNLIKKIILKKSKTKVDVFVGVIIIEYDGQVVEFNVHDINFVYLVNTIDFSVQDCI